MATCHFTNNTEYTFTNDIYICNSSINYPGAASSSSLSTAISTGTDKWVQLFVSKIVDIPDVKPSAEGIDSVNTAVNIFSQRVIKTPVVTGYTNSSGEFIPGSEIPNAEGSYLTGRKLVLEGVITQKVIYTALQDDQALHSASFLIPFSTFIIVDSDTALSKEYKISAYLEDVFSCLLSERSIFLNNTLFIKAV